MYSLNAVFPAQTLAVAVGKWSLFRHPNICPMWSLISFSEPIPAIAMPWYSNGSIFECQRNRAVNKLNIVCFISVDNYTVLTHVNPPHQVKQVASAVAYIHAVGEVHANITPVRLL